MQAQRIGQGGFPLFAVQRDADVSDARQRASLRASYRMLHSIPSAACGEGGAGISCSPILPIHLTTTSRRLSTGFPTAKAASRRGFVTDGGRRRCLSGCCDELESNEIVSYYQRYLYRLRRVVTSHTEQFEMFGLPLSYRTSFLPKIEVAELE
jgi:hypothetical protein